MENFVRNVGVPSITRARSRRNPNCVAGLCGGVASRAEIKIDRVARSRQRDAALGLVSHFFSFRGRVSRGSYFRHTLLDGAVLIAINIGIAFVARGLGGVGAVIGMLATLGALIVVIWSEIAVTVKRLHDIDRPGTHWFLLLIPVYNIYFQLLLLFKPGIAGRNRYGADPLVSGEGDDLLAAATRYEMNGDWERAFDTYRLAAEKFKGQHSGESAISCIERLREQIALGNQDRSTGHP